jgi:PIN domain nuclease of toxin-antitoxin system
MTEYVLDAGAVLANILHEPGGDAVKATLRMSAISAVNYAEVIAKLIEEGLSPREAIDTVEWLNCEVVEADKHRAILVGELHAETRRRGVSLGDRFCLALARERQVPLLTTDRRLAELDVGVEVRLIR